MTIPNNVFIFNLGRLWQGVVLEDWDGVKYLANFIREITLPSIIKKYLRELKKLDIAIEKKDSEGVDRILRVILKW